MTDGSHFALLVIDVQQGLFGKSTPVYQADALLENITCLIERARQSQVPVFYVQHSDLNALVKGSAEWQLHPRLQPLPSERIIHKLHGNAFEETDLQEALQAGKVNSLVITGLVTHGCVKASCIGALELGYRAILVKDGHSSFSKDAPQMIEKWNKKLGAMGANLKSTSEIAFN